MLALFGMSEINAMGSCLFLDWLFINKHLRLSW